MSHLSILLLGLAALGVVVAASRLAEARQRRAQRGAASADPDGVYLFTRPGCRHCRTLRQRLRDEISDGRVAVVDVAEAPERAAAYHVRSVPSVVIVRRGQVVEAFAGLVAPARLDAARKAAGL